VGNVITLLRETQEAFGYLPREAVDYFSELLNIAPSRFYGVCNVLRSVPLNAQGKKRRHRLLRYCLPCERLRKGPEPRHAGAQAYRRAGDMTEDKHVYLEKVNCVGACGIAPVFIH